MDNIAGKRSQGQSQRSNESNGFHLEFGRRFGKLRFRRSHCARNRSRGISRPGRCPGHLETGHRLEHIYPPTLSLKRGGAWEGWLAHKHNQRYILISIIISIILTILITILVCDVSLHDDCHHSHHHHHGRHDCHHHLFLLYVSHVALGRIGTAEDAVTMLIMTVVILIVIMRMTILIPDFVALDEEDATMIVIRTVIGSIGNAEDATMIVIVTVIILIIFMMIVITVITLIIVIVIVSIVSFFYTFQMWR